MKKLIVLVICFLTSFAFVNAQRVDVESSFRKEFRIALGVNAIQNLGTRKPFTDINEWAFSIPISAAFEYKFARNWSIEQAFNVNKYDIDSNLDGNISTKEYTFLGTNTNLKWYPNLLKSEKLKLFANAGIGVFKMDEIN